MLMITTTMGMLHWVHGNTTDTRPAVALCLVLVIGTTSLHDWLVHTTTTGDDADHGTAIGGQDLLCTRGQLDTSDALIMVVSDDGGIVARGAGKGTTITRPSPQCCRRWYPRGGLARATHCPPSRQPWLHNTQTVPCTFPPWQ